MEKRSQVTLYKADSGYEVTYFIYEYDKFVMKYNSAFSSLEEAILKLKEYTDDC